jgi:two-component system NtrC family sensor kinase
MPTTAGTKASGPLTVLSEIASRLAEGGEIVATVGDVIQRLQVALEATEVSLWLYSSGGLRRSASAGMTTLGVDEVREAVEAPDPKSSVIARRLVAMGQRIGVLAVNGASMTGDARDVVTIVANLLAPELTHAEDVHRLTGEVERGARQVQAERRLTARIIDALPLGLYVVDRNYRVQAWNSNREMGSQGVSRDVAMGKLIFEVLHRQPADALRAEFDEVFRTGRLQQFNIESDASGSRRTFRISKIPMRLEEGVVTHVLSIGEDITEWATAQDRWAQSEKLAAIGQLAAGVMHEINNPLATVAACAEGLALRIEEMRRAGAVVPENTDEYTKIIEEEVQRCKRIIDSLLTFSRPKSVEKSSTDLNAVIEQALFLVKHHDRFRNLRLQTILDPALEQVPANAEQLIQVFIALLINAADAMNEQGAITIRTRRGLSDAEAVIAEVIDEGKGIPRTELPKIFEPFYTTKPPGRGTGLGLSICYSIIAGHGGRIEVDSAVGAGTTFRILLPNVNAPARPAGDAA